MKIDIIDLIVKDLIDFFNYEDNEGEKRKELNEEDIDELFSDRWYNDVLEEIKKRIRVKTNWRII